MGLQHHSHHRHALSRRGAALWEIMFAAAVIILTGFVVIPELTYHHHTIPNSSCAVATLRTLTSAQEVYKAKWGEYGSAAQLGAQKLLDGQMAQMTRDASVEKSGFNFRMDCSDNGGGWCAICWPTGWDTTGEKAYWISADGTIKWRGTEGANPDWNRANYPKRLGESRQWYAAGHGRL